MEAKRLNPGDGVLLRHVGGGIFGIKERRGLVLAITTVRDMMGSRTTISVALSDIAQDRTYKALKPKIIEFGTNNVQLSGLPEWRISSLIEKEAENGDNERRLSDMEDPSDNAMGIEGDERSGNVEQEGMD